MPSTARGARPTTFAPWEPRRCTCSDRRGEATGDSDLFIDYDLASRFNAFDLIAIDLSLEDALDVLVDVTTRDGLHSRLRDAIVRSALRGFRWLPREFRHALDDMLEALDGIERATVGKKLGGHGADRRLKHGVQRGIEIVSEASRALPPEVRTPRSVPFEVSSDACGERVGAADCWEGSSFRGERSESPK